MANLVSARTKSLYAVLADSLSHVNKSVFKIVNYFVPTNSIFRHDATFTQRSITHSKTGSVVLVGAGPGDPDLLTVKATRALAQAEVVLFDWLVSKDILALIPRSAHVEFVGKRAGKHSMAQSQICQRMVELALEGKRVVRLKGGDPAIFARTAEETDALSAHNIPFSIIPGITAASGASAYSGIVLTHRDCAQSVRFVTATMRSSDDEPHWRSLAQAIDSQTLVFYMGLGRLSMISKSLIAQGVRPDMPIALVDRATTEEQIICKGTLANIVQKANDARLEGPAVIIAGHVVSKQAQVSTVDLGPSAQARQC